MYPVAVSSRQSITTSARPQEMDCTTTMITRIRGARPHKMDCTTKKNTYMNMNDAKRKTRQDPRWSIVLDLQSEHDIFCNHELLQKTWCANDELDINVNGKTITTNMKAKILGDYDNTACYCPDFATNIVSLKNLSEWCRVTYDSDDDIFILHRDKKPDMRFKKRKNGEYSFYVKEFTKPESKNVDDVDLNVNKPNAFKLR